MGQVVEQGRQTQSEGTKMSIEITRFDKDMDGSMEPAENGQWVRYQDVRELLESLDEHYAQGQYEAAREIWYCIKLNNGVPDGYTV